MFAVRAVNPAGSSNNSNAVTATIPGQFYLVLVAMQLCFHHLSSTNDPTGPPAVGQLDLAVTNFSLTVALPVSRYMYGIVVQLSAYFAWTCNIVQSYIQSGHMEDSHNHKHVSLSGHMITCT